MTTTIYKIVICTAAGTMVNSTNILFTVPKKNIEYWQERIRKYIINRYAMPADYSVDFSETGNYKFAKQNYISLKTRRLIINTMALVDADIDTKLNEAIKLLTDKLTKYQITRLSDDLMLRWRIMEATK